MAGLLILLLEQGSCAAGIADDFSVFKNLPDVVVVNLIILNFSGVVGKQDAETVQTQIQICRGLDVYKRQGCR